MNEQDKQNKSEQKECVCNKKKKLIKKIIIAGVCIVAAVLGILGYRAVDEIVNEPICYKPMIYIYPENEMEVTVELGNKKAIICSYPEYIEKWNILAKPNGDLTYISTGRNLYALYYESKVENIDKNKYIQYVHC